MLKSLDQVGNHAGRRRDTPTETRAFNEITQRLIDVIGRKLTAYIGNVNDVRAVVTPAKRPPMGLPRGRRNPFSSSPPRPRSGDPCAQRAYNPD